MRCRRARRIPVLAALSVGFLFQGCGLDEGGASAPSGDGGTSSRPPPGTDSNTAFSTVGGSVTGLEGTGLELQNNDGDDLPIARDGAFAFRTALAPGSAYAVRIKTQPAYQKCAVTAGSGTIGRSNVQDVTITCALFRTCKEVKADFPSAKSAVYTIRPGAEKAKTRCDMDYDRGGWTLIETTGNRLGPENLTEAGPDAVMDRATNNYMKLASMMRVAALSSQVHIREDDNPAISITSLRDARPIQNLRTGAITSAGFRTNFERVAAWTRSNVSANAVECDFESDNEKYPDIYWARGNDEGLHLRRKLSTWSWGESDIDTSNNVPMQVYLR